MLNDNVSLDGRDVELRSILYPAGLFAGGKKIRETTMKDLPALCARLMPEFDKRRSIKEMFTRKRKVSEDAPETNGPRDSIAEALQGSLDTETKPVTEHPVPPTPSLDTEDPLYVSRSPSMRSSQQQHSPVKSVQGKASPTKVSQQSNKRMKSSTPLSRQDSLKGQKSLKGFFKPTINVSMPVSKGDPISTETLHAAALVNDDPSVESAKESLQYDAVEDG